jgi:acyl-CoA thioesterase-1
MKRFFERIRQKALDVGQPPVLIVAFGDSNTQGVMEHRLLAPGIVYHRLVQERLEELYPTTTFSTINAGVSGDSARQAVSRVERDIIRYQPDLVFLSFGPNDAGQGVAGVGEFKEALGEIISRTRRETEADVILFTPAFMATRVSAAIHPEHQAFSASIIKTQTDGTLGHYAEAIREVARAHETPLVDMYREWTRLRETGVDTDLWLINGLNHPDRRGHRIIAQLVLHVLLAERDR